MCDANPSPSPRHSTRRLPHKPRVSAMRGRPPPHPHRLRRPAAIGEPPGTPAASRTWAANPYNTYSVLTSPAGPPITSPPALATTPPNRKPQLPWRPRPRSVAGACVSARPASAARRRRRCCEQPPNRQTPIPHTTRVLAQGSPAPPWAFLFAQRAAPKPSDPRGRPRAPPLPRAPPPHRKARLKPTHVSPRTPPSDEVCFWQPSV
jgi:hypothetical protein